MEATLEARPSYQAADLLGPDFAVPTHSPKTNSSQPRTSSDRRARKFFNSFPRIVLRPVSSADSALETTQSKSRSNKSLNGPRQTQNGNNNGALAHETDQSATGDTCTTTHESLQSNTARPDIDQDRGPKIKLHFWRILRSKKVPHIAESAPPQENAGSIIAGAETQPIIVVTDDNTFPTAIDPSHVINRVTAHSPALSIRSHRTTASHDITAMSGALPVNVVHLGDRTASLHSSILQDEVIPPPVTSEPCNLVLKKLEASQPGETVQDQIPQAEDHETGTINEEMESTKIYSPEPGMYVGKLCELPPPEVLQLQWRQKIRPQLVKNLRAVIASLPQSLTTSETTIEPELIMCGVSYHGQSTVTLEPTIWIRCGSRQCRKSVQRAVSDLSLLQQIPVHVTLHAPRQASTGQAPDSLFRVTQPDLVDEILPVNPGRSTRAATVSNTSGHAQLPTHSPFDIRVQSLVDNQRSACGLRVQFSRPNGANYICTIGGLILVDDAIVGLTTAHAIFDGPSSQEAYKPSPIRYPGHKSSSGRLSLGPGIKFSIPASLRAANFGNFYFPPRGESAHATLEDEDNHDFALLQLHAERSDSARNIYQSSRGNQEIDTISRDLTERAVEIVCSSEVVISGQLIEGDCVIIDKAGYWETRKIQLEAPLGKFPSRGSSGTWVVEGRALLGVITAVYDNEPYAHMVPITSIFSGIESMFNTESKRIKVEMIASRRLSTREHILVRKQVKSEPSASEDHRIDEYQGRLGLRRHIRTSLLMVLLVGFDASAYPVILPDVANTLKSMELIGCLGSAYLLGFGMTYPIVGRLHMLLIDLSHFRALIFLRLACITAFAVGAICSYSLTTVHGVVIGRAIAGIGAAGSISGIPTLSHAYLPSTNKGLGALFFSVYAAARTGGPIIAAAMTEHLGSHPAWRSFFLLLSIATAVAFFVTVASLLVDWRDLRAKSSGQHPLNPSRSTIYQILLRLDFFSCVWGSISMVSLQFALYIGNTESWNSYKLIPLFTAGFGLPLMFFILLQSNKHSTEKFLPAMMPFRALDPLQLFNGFCIALWGISFYSFSFFTPIWIRTLRNESLVISGSMYLPLAATHFFACLLVLPGIFRHVRHLKKLERRDIEASKRAQRDDPEKQEPQFVPTPSGTIVPEYGEVHQSRVKVLVQNVVPLISPIGILPVSLSIMALCAGISSTFSASTSLATLLGLQTLFSIGAGLGASQSALFRSSWSSMHSPSHSINHEETLMQPNLAIFAEMVGGSIGTAAAQAVFSRVLKQHISTDSDLQLILTGGATTFRQTLRGEALERALGIINTAITRTFFVATAAGALPVGVPVALGAALGAIAVSPLGWGFALIYLRRRRRAAEVVQMKRKR